MAVTDPGCRISWWALAGIGRTESRHGTYLGSAVGVDGRAEPPIVGPPLDGTNGFRKVPDSDGGALDGDAGSDRAVGPMQFLPGTWRTVGRDGNGDGRADPDNIYDAALGAAVYLCRSGDLSAEPALRGAYLTYNRSLVYVDTVIGFATAYRDAVALPSPAAR
ncbi:MAG: lytic transglycosylase domain-containing protein [Microthrixaceae bacterium]|nr:lytic transglycosylase domain-containing protein [Microthrixaceae bacterium]MCB9399816.1 lytic transglycosylase domain-containing protein [Microthrixaceae bacterium]